MKANTRYLIVAGFSFLGLSVSLTALLPEWGVWETYGAEKMISPVVFIVPLFSGLLAGLAGYFYCTRKYNDNPNVHGLTKNLETLLEINNTLISSIDLDVVLQKIIDKATYLINLNSGAIYLHEDEKLFLGATTPALPDKFPDVLRYDLLCNHPHIRKSLISMNPETITDTASTVLSEAEKIIVQARNLKSILYIPLVIENRPVGTIILGSVDQVRIFTEQEIDIYRTFSSQAALAIENARLYKKSMLITEELRMQNEEIIVINEELNKNYSHIQKINIELEEARRRAEESDKLKTAFLHNISHEIRTPLNAIAGFSNLITKPGFAEDDISKFSGFISSSTTKLLEIISDVIDISQIHSNQCKVHNSIFDFFTVIKEQISTCYAETERKGLHLHVNEKMLTNQLYIQSDEEKIRKIFRHILNNAIKFTNIGSISIDFVISQQEIVFSVSDTGIGIPDYLLDKIFEPFRQCEIEETRNYGGNGLGLTIAKAYIELLNGSIQMQSELCKGTCVIIRLPVKVVSGNASNEEINNNSGNFTILLVEDEESNTEYLKVVLSDEGFRVLHAPNGKDAVSLCTSDESVDLVLMDIKMPVMDGLHAVRIIRENNMSLPVIAHTAYAEESDRHEYLQNGFTDCICKPVKPDMLTSIVRKYLPTVR